MGEGDAASRLLGVRERMGDTGKERDAAADEVWRETLEGGRGREGNTVKDAGKMGDTGVSRGRVESR